jgi:hypothetical protein
MDSLHVPAEEPLLAPEVAAYAEACRTVFGLAEWDIWLCEHDSPGEDDTTAGYCELETRYLRATITIRRGLRPARVRSVIFHEMLHVALAFLAQAVEYIQELVPEKLRPRAERWYTDAEEQTIERLTRALRPHLVQALRPHLDQAEEPSADQSSAEA